MVTLPPLILISGLSHLGISYVVTNDGKSSAVPLAMAFITVMLSVWSIETDVVAVVTVEVVGVVPSVV